MECLLVLHCSPESPSESAWQSGVIRGDLCCVRGHRWPRTREGRQKRIHPDMLKKRLSGFRSSHLSRLYKDPRQKDKGFGSGSHRLWHREKLRQRRNLINNAAALRRCNESNSSDVEERMAGILNGKTTSDEWNSAEHQPLNDGTV